MLVVSCMVFGVRWIGLDDAGAQSKFMWWLVSLTLCAMHAISCYLSLLLPFFCLMRRRRKKAHKLCMASWSAWRVCIVTIWLLSKLSYGNEGTDTSTSKMLMQKQRENIGSKDEAQITCSVFFFSFSFLGAGKLLPLPVSATLLLFYRHRLGSARIPAFVVVRLFGTFFIWSGFRLKYIFGASKSGSPFNHVF